ncbi:MAG: hypothetical protein Fur0041_08430 [Bacteroidia bacterium]
MKKQLFAIASVLMLAGAVSFTSCKKEDTTAPTITITGGTAQSQSLPNTANGGTWTNPTATATDDEDGDISSSITVTGTVDPNTKGTYTLTYSVSDAAGNTATETVTVDIVNDAEFMAGSYAGDDTCQQSTVLPYSSPWTASSTVNNKVTIGNFGGFGQSVLVNATATGGNINFTVPFVLIGQASVSSATGTYTANGNSVTASVVYQWTDGTSTELCTSTYTK